jgi:hypothetical protein
MFFARLFFRECGESEALAVFGLCSAVFGLISAVFGLLGVLFVITV